MKFWFLLQRSLDESSLRSGFRHWKSGSSRFYISCFPHKSSVHHISLSARKAAFIVLSEFVIDQRMQSHKVSAKPELTHRAISYLETSGSLLSLSTEVHRILPKTACWAKRRNSWRDACRLFRMPLSSFHRYPGIWFKCSSCSVFF